MSTLETIYCVLFKPDTIFQNIKKYNDFYKSVLILSIVTLINSLYISSSFLSAFVVSFAITILAIFLGLFISMFISLGANFLGGNASIKDTFIIFTYSTLPFIFFPIFSISIFTKIFIFIWFIAIFSIGLKYLNGFSIAKAIISIFSIFGIFSLIFSLLLLVIILFLIASFL
jgi:hypothetical protein